MTDRYHCANYACKSKSTCDRFFRGNNPLKTLSEDRSANNILFPFMKAKNKVFFNPDKTGRCKYYINTVKEL